jgi:hypothetical protein
MIARTTITYYLNNQTLSEIANEKSNYLLKNKKDKFSTSIDNYKQIILSVSKIPSIKHFKSEHNNEEQVSKTLLEISSLDQDIVQFRFLDTSGWEKFRIDKIDGNLIIIPKQKLQYKGDRDYFVNSTTLTINEVYISPINLNKEGSPPQISYPFLPVIRIVTPVYDNQLKVGYLVINIDAKKLIILPNKPRILLNKS